MTKFFKGYGEDNKTDLAADGIQYGISIGRRAPMHKMHLDCLSEIKEAGLEPVVHIGSTNGYRSPFYNPLDNPMTVAQQRIQLKKAMPELDVERHVITQDDVGNTEPWCHDLSSMISNSGLAGQSVAHYRSKTADANVSGAIKPLSETAQGLIDSGVPVWESRNKNPEDDNIHASDLRKLDLNNLTSDDRQLFTVPDYIIQIAQEARERNPSKSELETHKIPVTMLDLTFDRLREEAGVTTDSIITIAKTQGEITFDSLTKATKSAINKLHEQCKSVSSEEPSLRLKVASASLNQAILNFTRNVPNIKTAIDKAIADNADVLSLQELVLTGYTGDDNFKWIRSKEQQKEMIELLQEIADYARERDPNLVLSVGFPFFYADKDQPVKLNLGSEEKPILVDNPPYNINNKPFNAVAVISGGKIQAISAKTIQPEGAAEYEARQFLAWPDYLGVKNITLCNGQTVPFGKVVMQLGKDKKKCATLYHEICAEAWPGLADDGKINKKEQDEGRYLNHLVKKHDISLVINPSASKPEPQIDKAGLRQKLCITGSEITNGGAYIYTNCSGLEAAPVAFEGGSIFANNGKITHTSARYDMHEVSYSCDVMQLHVPKKGTPHVVIDHEFRQHELAKKGAQAEWEEKTGDSRAYEEAVRNTTLWIRDYLQKTPGQQGFFVSLSGGQDSAYGAVAISQMIDLNIGQLEQSLGNKEKAVAAFVDQFEGLKYAAEVKRITQTDGVDAGIDYLKKQMLTCAYFPSENSSRDTRDAANFLINGGTRIDVKDKEKTVAVYLGKDDSIKGSTLFYKADDGNMREYEIIQQHEPVKGIGGTLHIMPIQDIVDSYLEIYASVDKKDLPAEIKERLSAEIKQCVQGERATVSDEFKEKLKRGILSWKNKSNDISLQNLQARVREPLALLFGNDENKIACVTSNLSEAVAGYWTFGGDGHMGTINLLGGIFKSDLRQLLKYLENTGLDGMPPIPTLHLVNQNKASAELRPLNKDGKIEQFDEDDMMPYEVLDIITRKIILGKNSPVEAYKQLLLEQPTYPDGKTPLFDSPERLVANIEQWCWRWDASQFKRVAAVTTPFLGQNVDPHGSVRTTIFSDMFKNGRAALKLEYLKDSLGGEEAFEQEFGKAFNRALVELKISGAFRTSVIKSSLTELKNAVQTYQKSSAEPVQISKGLAI